MCNHMVIGRIRCLLHWRRFLWDATTTVQHGATESPQLHVHYVDTINVPAKIKFVTCNRVSGTAYIRNGYIRKLLW
jgi:hypothetical protein